MNVNISFAMSCFITFILDLLNRNWAALKLLLLFYLLCRVGHLCRHYATCLDRLVHYMVDPLCVLNKHSSGKEEHWGIKVNKTESLARHLIVFSSFSLTVRLNAAILFKRDADSCSVRAELPNELARLEADSLSTWFIFGTDTSNTR